MILNIIYVVLVSLFAVDSVEGYMEECISFENIPGRCIHVFNCRNLSDIYFNTESIDVFYDLYTTSCGGRPNVCCSGYKVRDIPYIYDEGKSTTVKTTTTPPDPTHTLPTAPNCGITSVTNVRIASGRDARLGEFPWMAALGYKDDKNNEDEPIEWLCGGSLITEKHILTVAHCTISSLYVARLGDVLTNDTTEGANPMNVLIEEARPHEEYNRYTYENDIAVLSLVHPVSGPNIKPICLPIGDTRTFEKYYPFVAGWGKAKKRGSTNPKLQVAMIPVVPTDYCLKALKEVFQYNVIDDRSICAGYPQGIIDACEGDSGGPMMYAKMSGDNTIFYEIGAVSWGYNCAKPGYPGVYTRMTYFIDWIQKKLY